MFNLFYVERKTRLELATPTLARLCSTNWAISADLKCPRQESNLHVSQHSHLKRARLPFRHVGKWKRISERKTRLELATPTLARLCSTNWAISAFWRRFFRNASAKVLLFPKLTNFFLFFFQYSKIICSYMFFYLILQKLCVYSHTLSNNIRWVL